MQACEAISGVTADTSVIDCLAAVYERAQGKTENKMTTSTARNQVWPWRALEPSLTVVRVMGPPPAGRLSPACHVQGISLPPALFVFVSLSLVFLFKIGLLLHVQEGDHRVPEQSLCCLATGHDTCPQEEHVAGLQEVRSQGRTTAPRCSGAARGEEKRCAQSCWQVRGPGLGRRRWHLAPPGLPAVCWRREPLAATAPSCGPSGFSGVQTLF